MADRANTLDSKGQAVPVRPGATGAADRQQWVLIGGLSLLGAVGVAWGVGRSDPILIGLWLLYLLLATLFAYRVSR